MSAVKKKRKVVGSQSNRKDIRIAVLPTEIRGFLQGVESSERTPILLWDVTPDGVGIWLPAEITLGTKVAITFNARGLAAFQATIIWCAPAENAMHGFRAGLNVSTSTKDLRALYERFVR